MTETSWGIDLSQHFFIRKSVAICIKISFEYNKVKYEIINNHCQLECAGFAQEVLGVYFAIRARS